MKATTISGAALAAAAATLLMSGAGNAAMSDKGAAAPKMGHCMGANSCKGLSACKGGAPGLNACKGQGFSMTAEAPCKAAGLKFEKM